MSFKIDIIAGFLGAGKTTLIQKMLKENAFKVPIAIIENEFGEVGIDGSVLQETGIAVREINAGCICCSLQGDFTQAMEELYDRFQPGRIIIEPSGVGKLSDVLKTAEAFNRIKGGKLGMRVAVVDISKYNLYLQNFGEFYEDQIKHATTIIFSRTQFCDNETLVQISKDIRSINQKANLITTAWDKLTARQILAVAEDNVPTPANILPMAGHDHAHSSSQFDVWNLETPKLFNEVQLQRILELLDQGETWGTVLRAKGIVPVSETEWLHFDYIPGEIATRSTLAGHAGKICVIGKNLNKGALNDLFQARSE